MNTWNRLSAIHGDLSSWLLMIFCEIHHLKLTIGVFTNRNSADMINKWWLMMLVMILFRVILSNNILGIELDNMYLSSIAWNSVLNRTNSIAWNYMFFFPHFPVAVDGLRFEVDAQIENLDTWKSCDRWISWHDRNKNCAILSGTWRNVATPPSTPFGNLTMRHWTSHF
jgi:hypothetical protein